MFSCRTSALVLCAVFFSSFCVAQSYRAYVRVGSGTGIFRHDVTADDASFLGNNIVCNNVVTFPDFVLGAQVKLKIPVKTTADGADTYKEVGVSASWEKVYLGWNLPFCKRVRLWLGHGMPLYLPGSYLSQLDIVSAGARWVKDGIAVQYRGDLVSFGAGLTAGTTAYAFSDDLQAGSAAQVNLNGYGIPLEAGVSLTVKNSYDGSSSFSARDLTGAVFAHYKPDNMFALTAGYCINGAPVPTNTTFKYVERYGSKDSPDELRHCHVLTCNALLRWGNVTVDEAMEGAKSFDGGYYSFYTTVRVSVPVADWLSVQPAVWYFAVRNDGNGSLDRDSLTLFPRVVLKKGPHQLMLGTKIERRQLTSDDYHWIFQFPAYYRYTL